MHTGSSRTRAWLTLLRAPGIGPATLRSAISRHADAAHALDALKRDAQLAPEACAWLQSPDEQRLDLDEAWLAVPGHHLLTIDGDDFPMLLREVSAAPAALFVDGDPALLWSAQIAVVGARNASVAGLANAKAFARAFAASGFSVTSGLAEGVDGVAHTAALDAGGKTVAVLGTGIDLVYPRRHTALAARVAGNGALVSEFPPGTAGRPSHFPRRNRIISGLSLGTLVVEAGLRSGSLTTARHAAEQGREVFALPGSIHNPLAHGCHRLIRDGAKLVETAQEVIEDLHAIGGLLASGLRERLALDATSASAHHDTHSQARARDPAYARLLAALEDTPLALDELVERTQLTAAALSSMLLLLELEGVVVTPAGGYARAGAA